MNIAIDIRPLMNKQRTGVGEYTFELLNAIFKNADNNQYFLFYNSYKDVSENIPKWDYDNVHYVCTRIPNKIFSLLTWLGFIRLDKLILRHLERGLTVEKALRLRSGQAPSKDPIHKEGDPCATAKALGDTRSAPLVEPVLSVNRRAQDDVKSLDYFFAPNLNFLSLSRQTKLIITIHDLSFKILPECFPLKWRLVYKIINPRKQCQRADIILTPSENTKRDVVREWGIESGTQRASVFSEKVKVLNPGLCSNIKEKGVRSKEQIVGKYNLPEKYILYLGAIEPRKNILSIIEAYKKSSLLGDKYMLIIAGASGWKNEEIFKAIENTAGVKYIGYVDDEDKTALYKNASLFVFPSLYEGFGLPVLEALACGVPVITSNRSSLSEIFEDYVYLVNPNNVSEIKTGMEEVVRNGREFNKIDLEKFNWGVSAEKFLNIMSTDYGLCGSTDATDIIAKFVDPHNP
ncbi:MAG: glycosyltransferase family 1 protein [Candidatus Magasanikbacteria bacterium]